MDLDPAAVSVRISRLTWEGEEQYQVESLDENEQGEAIRVMVSVGYSQMGLATDLLGLKDANMSSYAVMRRHE